METPGNGLLSGPITFPVNVLFCENANGEAASMIRSVKKALRKSARIMKVHVLFICKCLLVEFFERTAKSFLQGWVDQYTKVKLTKESVTFPKKSFLIVIP
jgi:hypothetical protein